jgi:hypothetical protein
MTYPCAQHIRAATGRCIRAVPWAAAAGLALAAALGLGARPAVARDGPTEVDVELVLAVDVSYSMDAEEQALQRQGYIDALTAPQVLEAISKGIVGRIAVTYVEWAGTSSQEVVAKWAVIDGKASAEAFAAQLADRTPRRLYRTSISGAIDFASTLFEGNGFNGLKRVIDISGDGSNNQGRPVTAARDDAVAKGITINGLPLMLNRPATGFPEIERLDWYYSDCVIGGPGAFMVPMRDREQFAEAIRTKILTEVSLAPPMPDEGLIVKVQSGEPRVSCLFGERMWQQRWGN